MLCSAKIWLVQFFSGKVGKNPKGNLGQDMNEHQNWPLAFQPISLKMANYGACMTLKICRDGSQNLRSFTFWPEFSIGVSPTFPEKNSPLIRRFQSCLHYTSRQRGEEHARSNKRNQDSNEIIRETRRPPETQQKNTCSARF